MSSRAAAHVYSPHSSKAEIPLHFAQQFHQIALVYPVAAGGVDDDGFAAAAAVAAQSLIVIFQNKTPPERGKIHKSVT
ncbi:hypothetical protein HMPREF9371_0651 [Neisseria shayeganii 871]|uniref:Uncharacterized protein n=1 Tax=Neisseria shayeganii 871 TaxID=1032488 RepID=G4CGB2_9NEIS|nr:hypothetical protein HMPREF9371_0651 [Neisseria shayeganii 871]